MKPELVHDIPVKNPIDTEAQSATPPSRSHFLARVNKPVFKPIKDKENVLDTPQPNHPAPAPKTTKPLPKPQPASASANPPILAIVFACAVALILIIAAVVAYRKG